MMSIHSSYIDLVNTAFLIYGIGICLTYLMLTIVSAIELRSYLKKNIKVDWDIILNSSDAPKISLIAPAYNEGATIIDNVRSMLSLRYKKLEIIIVNDGSKDDSLEKLIKTLGLKKVNEVSFGKIPSSKVRGVYRSDRESLRNLIILDKENGGKSDALNAGINLSSGEFIACVDVDCILDRNCLLKLVKPFLEDNSVIAAGGVIRNANNADIKDGHLRSVKLDTNMLGVFQHLEYIRSFLIGRIAWSRLNSLLLVSGACGMFKKEVVIACGGYDRESIGEDMELVLRMRKYMLKTGQKHRVRYIPDSVCWTEMPSTVKVLSKQRNRWARGNVDTLFKHRDTFFNPRYKLFGMMSYPFYVLFEWFTPIFEFFGFLFLIVLIIAGLADLNFFFLCLITIYLFSIYINMLALYMEERLHFSFTSLRELGKLFLFVLIEPLSYHLMNVCWTVKGNFDWLKGDKSWGEMTRRGFSQ